MQFDPASLSEEIDTWKDVYGIEERYKAKFYMENDGKYWIMQVLDEWKKVNGSPSGYLRTLSDQTANAPFAECNFLKKPFLEACDQAGLFKQNVSET